MILDDRIPLVTTPFSVPGLRGLYRLGDRVRLANWSYDQVVRLLLRLASGKQVLDFLELFDNGDIIGAFGFAGPTLGAGLGGLVALFVLP